MNELEEMVYGLFYENSTNENYKIKSDNYVFVDPGFRKEKVNEVDMPGAWGRAYTSSFVINLLNSISDWSFSNKVLYHEVDHLHNPDKDERCVRTDTRLKFQGDYSLDASYDSLNKFYNRLRNYFSGGYQWQVRS